MGSAEEPGSLPQLAQEAVAEDACSPCHQQPSSCLAKPHCGAGALAMRNRCSMEPGGRGSAESRAEAPAVAQPAALEPGAGGRAEAEKAAGVGPMEKGEEPVPVSCSGQNGERSPGLLVLPDGSIAPPGSPVGEGTAVASAGAPCLRLLPEPCLKGRSKDPGSAPAPLKHVVFLEPAHTGPEPDGAGAAALSPEQGPVPPTCPQERSQEQPGASEWDLTCGSRRAPGAAPLPPGSMGAPPGDAGGKAPALLAEPKAQLGSPAAPGAGDKGDPALPSPPEGAKEPAAGASGAGAALGLGTRADAGQNPLGQTKGTGPAAPGSSQPASAAGRVGALPEAPAAAPSLKGQGKPGQSQVAPAEAGGGSGPPQSPAPEQQSAPGPGEEAAREGRTAELLSKTYSFELTPPPQDAGTQDAGTQAGSRVSLVSVAISPINPPDGAPAFTFHSRGPLKSPGPGLKPARKDAEMQVSIPVETRSVATGPMTPVAKSPQASYPEVRVKGAQEEPPEPIREVSWDEKGMTWEVYGATMEVEVLGMAIQKHLEKQIEEHGRQTVMTPQSTRASSVKGESKRQPSMFRALLQSLRRPRCCSRASPAAE